VTGTASSEAGTRAPQAGPAARIPACHDEVCITCSDTAVEVRVVRLLPDDLAVVATGQGEEEVSVALVTARPGDAILVHAREAIAVVSEPAPAPAARAKGARTPGGDTGGVGDASR
jgi:hydrogenase expression/formation protein HypC